MGITWDDLPGDAAVQISDAEQKVQWISSHVDDPTDGYDLGDLREDLRDLQGLITAAIAELGE